MINRVLVRGAVASLAAGLVATGALAVTLSSPATGSYYSAPPKTHKFVTFNVTKKGSATEVQTFSVYCKSNTHYGALIANRDLKVTSSGKFSYHGKAQRVIDGAPAGSETMTVSGKFVSATKAKGTAKFAAKPKLAGCPPPAFTATKH